MDHSICINPISMPATTIEAAKELLLDACLGVLDLNTGDDRFFFYFDDSDNSRMKDCVIADDGSKFSDFLDQMASYDVDLFLFLEEVEDKSPALDFLLDEQIEEIASCNFYIPDTGFETNLDTLGIAYVLEATLLSMNTDECWNSSSVSAARYDDGAKREYIFPIKNISKKEHGEEHLLEYEKLSQTTLEDLCPDCSFTAEFKHWLEDLDVVNAKRVRTKLRLASERDFNGGKPLFETLKNNCDGLREIRFSAYPGGAIRILFRALSEGNQAILVGFIKKADEEGYDEACPKAIELWTAMKNPDN